MHLIEWMSRVGRREGFILRRPARALLTAFGLFFVTTAWAQPATEIRWPDDRPALSIDSRVSALRAPARDHYHVIALMVEFQPDDSRFTTGDGTFDGDLFGGLQPTVDPLPHDHAYFEARLRFLKNYVERVSGGRTSVSTWLNPQIIRLPGTMGQYSPTGPDASSDAEMTKLASLVADAWSQTTQIQLPAGVEIDPDQLVFVIFHAGVGRDIELIGTTLDKTPEDLPSLFFGTGALNRLLGSLPTAGGYTVNHTLLLPRTETRRGQNFITGEAFLAEFSINGMLAATFFSRLGVPDLFNTETGASGIGPFGLMDPLGIFAFNGLFPPEPSAWTKHYLGWADTQVHRAGQPETLVLRAASADGPSDQLRVPISDAEYFLVENRFRGLDDGGVTLTVWREGQYYQERFSNHDGGFSRFNISDFPGGVVVDVSNYDWALPGGLDEDGNELDGGMLIWHIDERVISDGLTTNRVNVDPRHRGVNLREADGAQDIGYRPASDFGPQAHLGTPFDFYFEGNPVRVVTRTGREIQFYQNRFGPDTVPSSRTNDGGSSFVVIEDFSSPGPAMTVSVCLADEAGIRQDPVLSSVVLPAEAAAGSSLSSLRHGSERFVFARKRDADSGSLVAVDTADGTVRVVFEDVASRPAVTANGELIVVRASGDQTILSIGGEEVAIDLPSTHAPPIVVGEVIILPDARGRLWRVRADGTDVTCILCEDTGASAIASSGTGILLATYGRLRLVSTDGVVEKEWNMPASFEPATVVTAGGPDGLVAAVQDRAGENLVIVSGDEVRMVDAPRPGATGIDAYLVPARMGQLSRSRFIQAAGDVVVAYEYTGAVVSGFPLRLDAAVSAQPIVIQDDGGEILVIPLANGNLDAFRVASDRVERMAGFPLAVGRSVRATPALSGDVLLAVSEDGVLSAYRFESRMASVYGEERGDMANSSRLTGGYLDEPSIGAGPSLIASDTYNWPNPIRDGSTNIRVMTTEPADIDVHIVDGGGRTVERMRLGAIGANVPVEARWDGASASGIYFARIRATFADGSEDTRVIKMAVLR